MPAQIQKFQSKIKDVNGYTYLGQIVYTSSVELVLVVSTCHDENGLPVSASRYGQPMHIRREYIAKGLR